MQRDTIIEIFYGRYCVLTVAWALSVHPTTEPLEPQTFSSARKFTPSKVCCQKEWELQAGDFILLSGSRPSLEMLTKLTFWNGLEAAIPSYLSAWFGGKFMNNLQKGFFPSTSV